MLTVRFPNLSVNDLIVPGTAKLTFDITLASTNKNRTLVKNIGRAIIKKFVVRFDGTEVLSIDDYDVLMCYVDLWMNKWEKEDHNTIFQGIVIDGAQTENVIKHRINSSDKVTNAKEEALANVFKNKFCIPLPFELLNSIGPFYQKELGEKLTFELTFNDYKRVINSGDEKDSTYTINNLALEFDTIMSDRLASDMRLEYISKQIYYDRILRFKQMTVKDTETKIPINFNITFKSLKGILILFKKDDDFGVDTAKYINPKIENISITVEGQPNEIYANGKKPYHHFPEIKKHFGSGLLKNVIVGGVMKELCTYDMSVIDYYNDRYGLWIDFRSLENVNMHGTGRKIENDISLQIDKQAVSNGNMTMYVYLFMNAQINIVDSKLKSAMNMSYKTASCNDITCPVTEC